MKKKFLFLGGLSILGSLASCSFLGSSELGEWEDDFDTFLFDEIDTNTRTSNQNNGRGSNFNPNDFEPEVDLPESEEISEENNEVVISLPDKIELNYKGINDEKSAFPNSTIVDLSLSKANYNVYIDFNGDSEYFKFEELTSTIVKITALKESRVGVLSVNIVDKDSNDLSLEKEIKINSVMTDYKYVSDYNENKLGDQLLDGFELGYSALFDIPYNNDEEDIVFPSKIKYDGVIKDVSCLLEDDEENYIDCRDLFLPDSIIDYNYKSIYLICPKNYLHIEKSKTGFVLFDTLQHNNFSRFLSTEGALYNNQHNFPYNKATFSETMTFESIDWTDSYYDWSWSNFSCLNPSGNLMDDFTEKFESYFFAMYVE